MANREYLAGVVAQCNEAMQQSQATLIATFSGPDQLIGSFTQIAQRLTSGAVIQMTRFVFGETVTYVLVIGCMREVLQSDELRWVIFFLDEQRSIGAATDFAIFS